MISYDAFLSWAEGHFPTVITRGDEIKIDTPWADDNKQHLWCNPTKNAYHCWKSERHGNLYDLVMEVDKCSFREAAEILGSENEIRSLEKKLDEFFNPKEKIQKPIIPNEIELPTYSYLITDLPEDSDYRKRAEQYLASRHIPSDGFYVCAAGRESNRIVIPYRAQNGSVIYWNARDLSSQARDKYLGPENKIGVAKHQVLYFPAWPKPGEKIYLTEGEFDALSLSLCGFRAAACGGKNVHDLQLNLLHVQQYQLLKECRICIAFDADKSGVEALNKIARSLVQNGISKISYVFPEIKLKDWNAMLEKEGKEAIQKCIQANEREYDPIWSELLFRV